jgi:hypothetical protein
LDPWTEYDTTTGQAVDRGPPRTPPPPYELLITMEQANGQWRTTSFVQDTSKTCTR